MSWIKNKIKSWLSEDKENEKLTKMRACEIEGDGLRFRIVPAYGGYVVEFRSYDLVKDYHQTNLHIITNDQEFSQRVSEIITLELLRK